jgi:hypothetical protein
VNTAAGETPPFCLAKRQPIFCRVPDVFDNRR